MFEIYLILTVDDSGFPHLPFKNWTDFLYWGWFLL